jgi:F0F1-type ATP synthase membrane subunit b/b'
MEKINFDVIFRTNLKQIENALKDLRKIIKQMGKQVIEIDLKPSKNTAKEFLQKIIKSPFESELIPRDLAKKILAPVFSALPFQFKGVLKFLYGDIDRNLVDYQKKLEKFNKDVIRLEKEQLKREKELQKQKEKERKEINRMVKELQKEIEKEEKERLRREKELQKQRERQEKEFKRSIEKAPKELANRLAKPLFDTKLIPKELQLKTLLPAFSLLPNQFKNVLNTLFNDINKNFNNILEKAKKDIENKLSKPLLGSKLIPKNLLINTLLPTYGILPDQIKAVLKPLENLALGFKKAGLEKDKFRDNLKTLSPNFSELEKRSQRALNSLKRDFRDLSFELGMFSFQLFILIFRV